MLDLEPLKSDPGGVHFAKLTMVGPSSRGLGVQDAMGTYDLRAGRFATEPVRTSWGRLDRETGFGDGLVGPRFDSHEARRLQQRLDAAGKIWEDP